MIDIKFLRENPEVVKENIRKKFQEHKLPLVDEVIELDEQARKTQQEADEIRANRNKLSKQVCPVNLYSVGLQFQPLLHLSLQENQPDKLQ